MNKIKKRKGQYVAYDPEKIKWAIVQANNDLNSKISEAEVNVIYETARKEVEKLLNTKDVSVDEINDIVEKTMMKYDCYDIAKQFIEYRYNHKLIRDSNTTDESIFELIKGKSDYWNNENSNKDAKLVTTQRDYIAGITSTDIARRLMLPKDVVEAHDQGIIHVHDMDYLAENARNNCSLVNLEDMLQNGTIINGVAIEKPHRFLTACTITSQIIVGVSSAQYGGVTITLTHLAPFVRDSFRKHYKFYVENMLDKDCPEYLLENLKMDDVKYKEFSHEANKYAKAQLKKEIEDGVQTFNYQINSMSSTNGQLAVY